MKIMEVQTIEDKAKYGYHALKLLRSMFADAGDPEYRLQTMNKFKMVKLKESKSVCNFTRRFVNLY